MTRCIRFICTLLLLGTIPEIRGQSLFFEHLGVKDGLSQHTVHDIYQDEFEQIWIATRDGLNKYDGNKIEIIKPSMGDTLGLWGNNIQRVTGNKRGKLYVQCQTGLAEYDLYSQRLRVIAKSGVSCFYYGRNRLWIGDENQIGYLDEERDSIVHFKTLDDDVRIRVLLETSDGDLYVGCNYGLMALDRNAKAIWPIGDIDVISLYEDTAKRIWFGTLHDGLFCMNPRNEISNYRHDPQDPKSVSSNYIRSICQDDLGGYWIGTFKGLDFFNHETKEFRNYSYSNIDNHSISDISVWCVHKDRQGSLWIGTFFGGVNVFNPEFSFNRFYRPMGTTSGPSGGIISRVIENAEGNLWICTDYDGLNYFDVKKNRFTYYKHTPGNKNSLSSNTLKDLCLDEENHTLWIGSHLGGLDRMDTRTGTITRIGLNTGNKATDRYVRCIERYKGELLLGTHNSIQRYDIGRGSTRPLIDEDYYFNRGQVWDMLIDRDENLWFSIYGTVFCYDLKNDRLLESPRIEEIEHGVFFEDSKGDIWIGSAGKGIFVYSPLDGSLRNFHTENSSLSDDYILDINESATGYILITTNKGLSRYEPSNRVFYNYHNNHFFPFEALNEKSLCVTRDGNIILSSLFGMMIISEKDLLFNPKPYRINLTSLSVNNKPVIPDSSGGILRQSVTTTDTIVLKERQNVVSIDFATTNFIKALMPEIQYKLEGFDEQWIDARSFDITYTNLKPGSYKLKIRAVETSSGYEVQSQELIIIVKPYFYKTWYAYVFYILLASGFFYLIYSQLRLKDSLRNADIQSKHMEEVNQSKLRFFINVSHEIRTPVTLMIAQLDMLLNNSSGVPPTILHKLRNVKRNAMNLKKLINELLDFRKHELGYARLHPVKQDLIAYLNHIFTSFQDYANSLNINTTFVSSEQSLDVCFDSGQMDKVFYNLLSNAFKFTPPLGSVSMTVRRHDETVEISVGDTGIGIKPENISEIFNRFYQAQDTDSLIQPLDPGTGIGLALVKSIIEEHRGTIAVVSNLGKGSVFKVTLPLGEMHSETECVVRDGAQDDNEMPLQEEDCLPDAEPHRVVQKNKTILIVEDGDEMREVLSEIFSPVYRVITLSTGQGALARIKETMPDLILLDIMLPHVSGIELCKKIKSDLITRSIPVVLLTAAATPEKRIEGLQIGADDYITKPFDAKELVVRCNGLINNRLLLKDAFALIPGAKDRVLPVNRQDMQLLEDATSVILKNIDDPVFGIDRFASALNISRSSLFTKIKEITGETPKDFIIKIRLQKSIELLEHDGGESISNIAFGIGFSDPSYFIRLFKAHYGMTPGQYKRTRNR